MFREFFQIPALCVFCDRVVLHSLAKLSESGFDVASIPWEKILLRRPQPYPRGDDRERITRACQAAEALFTAKPPVSAPSVPDTPPADRVARKPRVLGIVPTAPSRDEEVKAPVRLEQRTPRDPAGAICPHPRPREIWHDGCASRRGLWDRPRRRRAHSPQRLRTFGVRREAAMVPVTLVRQRRGGRLGAPPAGHV